MSESVSEKKLIEAAKVLMNYLDASVCYFVNEHDLSKAKSMANISAIRLLTKIIDKDFIPDG